VATPEPGRKEQAMFAVIFEVQPKKERWDDYLDLAKQLKPKLEAIDGFIDNERFESSKTKGRVLSLSTWRDEKAVVRWRSEGAHHGVQERGRSEIFADYHLRVGEITADSAPPKGGTVDEKRFDETEIGDAKFCTISEISGRSIGGPEAVLSLLRFDSRADGLIDHEIFDAIYNKDKHLLLAAWRDRKTASGWTPAAVAGAGELRHRQVRIIRDYGMFERREAPQYYPEAKKAAE
jgi:heme-degrading monooxygenase HmoA